MTHAENVSIFVASVYELKNLEIADDEKQVVARDVDKATTDKSLRHRRNNAQTVMTSTTTTQSPSDAKQKNNAQTLNNTAAVQSTYTTQLSRPSLMYSRTTSNTTTKTNTARGSEGTVLIFFLYLSLSEKRRCTRIIYYSSEFYNN